MKKIVLVIIKEYIIEFESGKVIGWSIEIMCNKELLNLIE